MIISFCGHSSFHPENREELKTKIFDYICETAENNPTVFYLGGYGDFDDFAKTICVMYKEKHPTSKLVFITPYGDESYLEKREPLKNGYDEIVFPDVEATPKKYAITARNKWMIRESDLVIAYIDYPFGGAAKTLDYAKKINVKYKNFGRETSY